IKAIAINYGELEQDDKALEFIAKARVENPNDYGLIIDEANIYFRAGDNAKFQEKLEEAIALKPDNAELHYRVGSLSMDVGDTEKAKKHLLKAIELNPNHSDAYFNMAVLIQKGLKPVEDEMNANASNFAKYDKIKAEKYDPILKESLPYLEKSYELNPDESIKSKLNAFYESLDMDKRIE
ncbi:MAG: tetratricopeptide repeat protein, partial [Urechidicola sp.]|nr:tetratricopeptide repeat protein [Urechidicola sp.]